MTSGFTRSPGERNGSILHSSILAWRIPQKEAPGEYNPWGRKESDRSELLRHTHLFLKSLLNLLQCCFCFMFWDFGPGAYGILAPQPVIEPAPSALEGEVLAREVPVIVFLRECQNILRNYQ